MGLGLSATEGLKLWLPQLNTLLVLVLEFVYSKKKKKKKKNIKRNNSKPDINILYVTAEL